MMSSLPGFGPPTLRALPKYPQVTLFQSRFIQTCQSWGLSASCPGSCQWSERHFGESKNSRKVGQEAGSEPQRCSGPGGCRRGWVLKGGLWSLVRVPGPSLHDESLTASQ